MMTVTKIREESVPTINYLDEVNEGVVSDNQDVQRYFCSDDRFINGIGVTVLTGDYLPPIILGEIPLGDGIVQRYIVDAMQRTSALMKIRYGNHKFTSAMEDDEIEYQTRILDEHGVAVKDEDGNFMWEKKSFHLKGRTFDELPDELKKRFDKYQLRIVTHQNCTMESISKLIRRYNNHKAMGASQRALTWIPTYARQIKSIGKETFFKTVMKYSDPDRKNGNYMQLICNSVMVLFHMDKFKKDAKSANGMLEDNSNREEFEIVRGYLRRIEDCCGSDCKDIFVKKDISSWISVFDKFARLGLPDQRFGDFIKAIPTLSNVVIGDWSYNMLDKEPGTTGKKLISQKIDTYTALMYQFLHIEKENNKVESNDSGELSDIDFVETATKLSVDESDIQEYKDYINDTVRVSSPLYHKCYQALLAITAYVYNDETDQEFSEWIDGYANHTYEFDKDQLINFNTIKSAFDNYMKKGAVA